jgi:hypothetical protein
MTGSSLHTGAMARNGAARRARFGAALAAPPLVVACLAVLALLGAALLWAVIAKLVWPVDTALTNASDGLAGHDFIAFYAAGRYVAQGAPAAPYDVRNMIAAYFSILTVRPNFTPFAYPPQVLLLLEPLGWLTPSAALAVWYAVIAGAAIAAVQLASGTWRVAALAPLALPTVVNFAFGQNGTISTACFAVIFTCWTRAPALAGVALGALAYKPHLVVVPGILALCFGAWRIIAAAAATLTALVAASVLAYGIDPWLAWAGAIAGQIQYITDGRLPAYRLATIYVLLSQAGLPALMALAVHLAVAVAAVLATLWTWRRTDDAFARALALTLAALLVPPYAFDYDSAILLVPIALLAAGGRAAPTLGERGLRWMLALSALPMLVLLIASTVRISPMAPLLALLLAIATLQVASARATTENRERTVPPM